MTACERWDLQVLPPSALSPEIVMISLQTSRFKIGPSRNVVQCSCPWFVPLTPKSLPKPCPYPRQLSLFPNISDRPRTHLGKWAYFESLSWTPSYVCLFSSLPDTRDPHVYIWSHGPSNPDVGYVPSRTPSLTSYIVLTCYIP